MNYLIVSVALICFCPLGIISCEANTVAEEDTGPVKHGPVVENNWRLGDRPGFEAFHGNDKAVFKFGMENLPTNYNPKYAFYYAQARMLDFELNGNSSSKEAAFEIMEKALANLNENDPPFQLWAAIDCYLRWRHETPESLKLKFQSALINTKEYDYHNTQNKHIMSSTARFLASETWPEANFGSNYSNDDPTGKKKILEMMDAYVLQGEREHNSTTYFAMHFGSILSLADLAQDPEIKRRAKMVVDWLLISAAAEWHNGYWAAAAERVYKPFREQGVYRAGTSYMYLYFGGRDIREWGTDLPFVLQGLCAHYRMPEYIYKISQKRDEPYIHRETHLHPLSGTRTFYLQTYMTKDFAVFSQNEDYTSWLGWMNQMIRWGVHIDRPEKETCLFIQHPHGGKDSAPEFGETEFGQVFQNEKTVVGVFDIPANSQHPFLKGWIPSAPEAVIDSSETSGKLFLHYGTTAIALQLSENFNWEKGEPNFFVRNKSKLGFAVEVYPVDELLGATPAEQLQNLSDKISATNLKTDFANIPAIVYTDSNGQKLETRLHEDDYLNGSKIDYSKWPLLKNPWVEQAYEGKTMTLNVEGQTIVYDFEKWEIKYN